jgi:hypothetical protein
MMRGDCKAGTILVLCASQAEFLLSKILQTYDTMFITNLVHLCIHQRVIGLAIGRLW